MKHKYLNLLMLLTVVGLISGGCRRTPKPEPLPPPPPGWDQPVSEEQRQLRELGLAVQIARDARAEADAIRRFQDHLRRNGMTYKIETYRVNEDRRVVSPTVQPYPVRAVVDVFRGRERLHQFVFIPKENQNLALLIA